MTVVAVVGGQWGDEGKGKIVDLLAERADVVARCQGGNNAGHTVVNPLGEFKLNLIPSGVFDPRRISIMGNGMVINPQVLLAEIDNLTSHGVDVNGLRISDRAHVVMPYHVLLDQLEEEARGARSIGTTRRGIGPAYADKVARIGIRMGDLLDEETFSEKLATVLDQKNHILKQLYCASPLSYDDLKSEHMRYARRLAVHITETTSIMHQAVADGKHVLLEGAQGTLLGVDFGTYPYVTSSSPTAGGACEGVGLGPTCLDQAMGVFKAYTTRVGKGPFPTELANELGDHIRERGSEYGTTTGRPRRCGWFDAVVVRHATQVNGLTSLAVTKLDVLDGFKELKLCTGYRHGGGLYKEMPADLEVLTDCVPVYQRMKGWTASTTGATTYKQLPVEAKRYLTRIEDLAQCRIDMISTGSKRAETIVLRNPLDCSRRRPGRR